MNQSVTGKLTPKKRKHTLRIIFLISLFIHLIFLLIFLTINFQYPLKNAVKAFQEKIQKFPRTELPASLKPKKSNFGTPVMFENTPEPEPQEATLEQTKPAPIPEPVVDAPQELSKNIEKLNEKDRDTARNKQIDIMVEPETKKPLKQSKPEEKTVQKKQLTPREKAPAKEKEIKKEKTITRLSEQKPEQPQPPFTADAPRLDKAPLTQSQKPAPPKRNILAMTNGFLENLKNKGDDLLERKGDDTKRPDFSEYKYLSYEARINWHLQAAWKENHANYTRIYEGKAAIEFVIDQYGNLVDLQLRQSSGSNELDNVILENTKRAAPFPPLPKHFKTEYYRTGKMVKVSADNYGF